MDPWQPPQPQQQPQPLTPKRQNQIQGPRPTPLKVSKDSVKIKKPPKHPQHYPPPPQPYVPPRDGNQPVIIYSVSPKPYFVEPSDFRSLVQHLTGRNVASPVGEPPVSPAARFAALERTSPKERDRWWGGGGGGGGDGGDAVNMMLDVDLISQMPGFLSPGPGNFPGILSPGFGSFSGILSPGPGNFPGVLSPAFGSLSGILSPAPGNLPVIPPGMFSPAGADGAGFSGLNELSSPFMSNFGGFLQSPSNLLFANNNVPFVSPSPTTDFYNIFDL